MKVGVEVRPVLMLGNSTCLRLLKWYVFRACDAF
jgi:hypothetical protein